MTVNETFYMMHTVVCGDKWGLTHLAKLKLLVTMHQIHPKAWIFITLGIDLRSYIFVWFDLEMSWLWVYDYILHVS